jgi:hypothetical protein
MKQDCFRRIAMFFYRLHSKRKPLGALGELHKAVKFNITKVLGFSISNASCLSYLSVCLSVSRSSLLSKSPRKSLVSKEHPSNKHQSYPILCHPHQSVRNQNRNPDPKQRSQCECSEPKSSRVKKRKSENPSRDPRGKSKHG